MTTILFTFRNCSKEEVQPVNTVFVLTDVPTRVKSPLNFKWVITLRIYLTSIRSENIIIYKFSFGHD